jgi:hypothetical protein
LKSKEWNPKKAGLRFCQVYFLLVLRIPQQAVASVCSKLLDYSIITSDPYSPFFRQIYFPGAYAQSKISFYSKLVVVELNKNGWTNSASDTITLKNSEETTWSNTDTKYKLKLLKSSYEFQITISFSSQPQNGISLACVYATKDTCYLALQNGRLFIPLTLLELFSAILIAIEHQDLLLLAKVAPHSPGNPYLLDHLEATLRRE